MEQGTPSQPNLQSLDRLTGTAVFTPTGQSAGVDLGDIALHALSLGAVREKRRYPVSRDTLLETEETIAVAPTFSIEGQQYHTAVLPFILLGVRNADVPQNALYDQSRDFVAASGKVFDLGLLGLSNVSVKVGSTVMVPDRDYFAEPNKGLIRLPESPYGYGIQAGDTFTVFFDAAPLLFESYTALSQLDQAGTLKLWEMDAVGVKNLWSVPGSMSADAFGDGDPLKHRRWKLRFSPTGFPAVLRRKDPADFLYA